MTNQLINEISPYLRQHAGNPVDWYPWSDSALEKARQEDKPIFLSIGYAACHWCHVMAHESFEDPRVAEYLNRHFVSIKVDREEHPELDNIYMSAVVAMTGQGGWPMSVFLTPALEPFYAGTYFPPEPRHGLPAFSQVLEGILHAWQSDRPQILSSAAQIHAYVEQASAWTGSPEPVLQADIPDQCVATLTKNYDWQNGGWGRAPKFPQPMTIDFLLGQAVHGNSSAKEIAFHALDCMAQGGMYDLVGGGFHRYSTDATWTVPHFEKMLYDNALLALVYLHAYLIDGKPAYKQICTATLDFVLREMTNALGGFYSSLDADLDGQEGAFYLWSLEEIRQSLSPAQFTRFGELYETGDEADCEGKLVIRYRPDREPTLPGDLAIPTRLLEVRGKRIRPAPDQKVLVSWNSLAMRSFAEAGRYLDRPDYLLAAQCNADFLLSHLVNEGHLWRTWLDERAHVNAFLEDYAGLAIGLLSLYQADFNPRWYSTARELMQSVLGEFSNPAGGFYDTPANRQDLMIKPVYTEDNATPSGNSLAAMGLLWLSAFDENPGYRRLAEQSLGAIQEKALAYPPAYAFWLQAFDFSQQPVQQVALVWPDGDQTELSRWRTVIDRTYNPGRILAGSGLAPDKVLPGLLTGRPTINDTLTAYLCRDFVCLRPVNDPEALAAQLS